MFAANWIDISDKKIKSKKSGISIELFSLFNFRVLFLGKIVTNIRNWRYGLKLCEMWTSRTKEDEIYERKLANWNSAKMFDFSSYLLYFIDVVSSVEHIFVERTKKPDVGNVQWHSRFYVWWNMILLPMFTLLKQRKSYEVELILR